MKTLIEIEIEKDMARKLNCYGKSYSSEICSTCIVRGECKRICKKSKNILTNK